MIIAGVTVLMPMKFTWYIYGHPFFPVFLFNRKMKREQNGKFRKMCSSVKSPSSKIVKITPNPGKPFLWFSLLVKLLKANDGWFCQEIEKQKKGDRKRHLVEGEVFPHIDRSFTPAELKRNTEELGRFHMSVNLTHRKNHKPEKRSDYCALLASTTGVLQMANKGIK